MSETAKNTTWLLLFAFLAVILLLVHVAVFDENRTVLLSAHFLSSGVYIIGLALFGLLFISVHVLASARWILLLTTYLQRFSNGIWLAVTLMLAAVILGFDELYDWPEKYRSGFLSNRKSWYFNPHFFLFRVLIVFSIWILFYFIFKRKYENPIYGLPKQRKQEASYLVVFAILFMVFCWDWLFGLSINWHSTLYSWYYLVGVLLSGTALLIIVKFLTGIYLPARQVKYLGTYLFAFAVLWAYLWYSQYMLIWYANIPLEVHYFQLRLEYQPILFYANMVLNFALPFVLLLIPRIRTMRLILIIASTLVLIGQWLDKYLAVMPGIADNFNHRAFILELITAVLFVLILLCLILPSQKFKGGVS